MPDAEIQFTVSLSNADADAEQLDEQTKRLARDLRDAGADYVEAAPAGKVPEGAKGDPASLGALIVGAATSCLAPILNFIQALIMKNKGAEVELESPSGLKMKFTSERPLTHEQVVELVDKLSAEQQKTPDAPES